LEHTARAFPGVKHADLPDELKTATGEFVATVWKSAQTKARESVEQLRREAASVAESARNTETEAKVAAAAALDEVERTQDRLQVAEGQIGRLRQELAAAAATNDGVHNRLEDTKHLLAQAGEDLARTRHEHAIEREKFAERTRLAEQRFGDMEKRVLLEIDRERTAAAKLQKRHDSEGQGKLQQLSDYARPQ
jgi:hypothetical protein